MSINAIYSSILSLPSIASSLISRSNAVTKRNPDAESEAQVVAILSASGTAFALFGRAAYMLSQARFSMTSLLMYGLMGFGGGITVSSPAIYSFFSKMQNREASITRKDVTTTWFNGCI
jgi:hypothetical protein